MSRSVLLRFVACLGLGGVALVWACLAATREETFDWIADLGDVMLSGQTSAAQTDGEASALRQRREQKEQAVQGCLSGRLTFGETARKFREAELATQLPWDDGGREAAAQAVLSWVAARQADDPRAVKALPRLRAEFEARFDH
jgi:hypothetical protein